MVLDRKQQRPAAWFLFLLGEWSVANIGYFAVLSILSIYFLQSLGLPPGQAAGLMLLNSVSFRLNRIFLAPVIDRLVPRMAIFLALCIGGLGYLGMALTTSPLLIMILLP